MVHLTLWLDSSQRRLGWEPSMANTPAAGGMNALAHASKKNFSSLNWRIWGGGLFVCLLACFLFCYFHTTLKVPIVSREFIKIKELWAKNGEVMRWWDLKRGDMGSSPHFAIIFEFCIWLVISLLRALIALSTWWDSWMRSIFPNLESTEKVIKIQELFPVFYKV